MIHEKFESSMKTLGFLTERLSDTAYAFDFDGLHLIARVNSDDPEFLSIEVPGIFTVTPENRVSVLEALEKVNAGIKYAKLHTMDDDEVWVAYHRWVGKDAEITPDILEHIIKVTAFATNEFRKTIAGATDED